MLKQAFIQMISARSDAGSGFVVPTRSAPVD